MPTSMYHPDQLERRAREAGVVLDVRELRSLEAPCTPDTAAAVPGDWLPPTRDTAISRYFYYDVPKPDCKALSQGMKVIAFESDCCDAIDGSFACAMHLMAGTKGSTLPECVLGEPARDRFAEGPMNSGRWCAERAYPRDAQKSARDGRCSAGQATVWNLQ